MGLAPALARGGQRVIVVDLRPEAVPKRRRRSLAIDPASLASALGEPEVNLTGLAVRTGVPGVSLLQLGDVAEAVADGGHWLTNIMMSLSGRGLTLVVEGPPVIGEAAARWVVVPTRDGECDAWGRLIGPLTAAGFTPTGDRNAADALGMTIVAGATLGGDDVGAGVPAAVPDPETNLIQRTYHLRPTTVATLELTASSLGKRLGRHVRKSKVVAWSIMYTQPLEHLDRVGPGGDLVQRTYHLKPDTIGHLSQVGVLASRAAGRHMRLSAVVDLAVRLFAESTPQEQERIIEWDRRRRPANRA